mmetsp:Transcript_48253/g.149004  ORF Transcript_48253/g.149004 Transcript_48253/m.149004 type:complete len:194 (-) Transcript_48253:172-753(-)
MGMGMGMGMGMATGVGMGSSTQKGYGAKGSWATTSSGGWSSNSGLAASKQTWAAPSKQAWAPNKQTWAVPSKQAWAAPSKQAWAPNKQAYDAVTEQELDQWVQAKRSRDFETADALRSNLRARGVDPDTARPDDFKGGRGGMAPDDPLSQYGSTVEEVLDCWVEAKRNHDFPTADSIRSLLRAQGVDPDTVRP